MNSTDSLSSSASFSTALSTSFSASALGSVAGEESYVCVHDAGRLWLYEPEGAPSRDADEEVRKSWFDLQWGFDPDVRRFQLPAHHERPLLTRSIPSDGVCGAPVHNERGAPDALPFVRGADDDARANAMRGISPRSLPGVRESLGARPGTHRGNRRDHDGRRVGGGVRGSRGEDVVV